MHSLGDNFKLRGAQNSTYEITAVNIEKNATAAALINNAALSNNVTLTPCCPLLCRNAVVAS